MDILEKIKIFCENLEGDGYIERESLIKILDFIIEDCSEDKIFLETIKTQVLKHWSINNYELRESIDNLFAYYGIKEKKGVEKKLVMEKRGNLMIRTPKLLKHITDIKELQ